MKGADSKTVSENLESGGIGFDDLLFAPGLRRLLVPAGGTGNLDLVDPDTHAVTPIAGFSTGGVSGHDVGSHCVAADDRRNAWVCDPDHGQLFLYSDSFARAAR